MRTYPFFDQEGVHTQAFEIENSYVSVSDVVRVLEGVEGVNSVERPAAKDANDGVRAVFRYDGQDCDVWEPFGDNSRYLIGPREPKSSSVDLVAVEAAFERYRPTLIRLFFGNLVSFRLRS